MTKTAVQFIILSVILILVQTLVLDHICIFGIAVPIVYIYILLRLPVILSVSWQLTIAFILGLTVDTFTNTYGLNALCATILAALRNPVLRLYVSREDELSRPEPSAYTLGLGAYLRYLATLTLIYCTLVMTIESMTLLHPWRLTAKIAASTTLSTTLMWGIDTLLTPSHEKRL